MAATVRIFGGPPGSGKTARLRARAAAWEQESPGATLWLVPTRRHAAWLGDRLAEMGKPTWRPPVITFEEVARALVPFHEPSARPLSTAQRRLMLDELIAEGLRDGRLARFERVAETRGFAQSVGRLFDELRSRTVEPADFARSAALAQSEGGEDLPRLDQCARLYADFQRRLRVGNLFDAEECLAHAAALLTQGRRTPLDRVTGVFVDGFASFTPSQLRLLTALAAEAREVCVALTGEEGEQRAELFETPRATGEALRAALDPEGTRIVVETCGVELAVPRPAGLRHLECQLFLPTRTVQAGNDAEGLVLLEAPGMLGEARMVARRVKALLLDGVPAEEILITLRDLEPYAALLREVFGEYGIPLDLEGAEPLLHQPAVATLLRALRLADEDWPFAGLTALLRSGYFAPAWPEADGRADMPQRAEILLRLLGEPRGRETYLAAVQRWAENPLPGLEDEQAEESRRRRTHELARECLPFVERLLRAWDGLPARASFREHLDGLRRFAEDFGFFASASGRDRVALDRLFAEARHWAGLDALLHGEKPRPRQDFVRAVWALAGSAGLARTARGPGRVRVLSAGLARTLPADYVFLMGLGERGFPLLTPPDVVLDEPERQALRRAGVSLPGGGEMLAEEMFLFYEIVTRPRRQLVLSYPAVDEKGQGLLPGSFLATVQECFAPGALPVERRAMLLQGYDRDRPLSPAEYRVQAAQALRGGRRVPLGGELAAHLHAARRMVDLRLGSPEFGPYDGRLRDPAVLAELARLHGPEKVYSPTALEDYVACPFRFFLSDVLKLTPLEEPAEEIEVTRRGQAFHRALARLHQQLKAEGLHEPGDAVEEHLQRRLDEAVAEYAARASSPASRELWRLEGERLKRFARRYGKHWRKFREPWGPRGVAPRPFDFEIDFGLPASEGRPPAPPLVLRFEDVEVRISGRIDRVDVAELEDGLGFWIIDYKTGRSHHYTSGDLREYRRLQLTLYALAVEQVLLAGQNARPLGLAYWMVGEDGPKIALPGRNAVQWFHEAGRWHAIREELRQWVATLVAHIRQGVFALKPRSEHCTQTCDFGQICRITQARGVAKTWELPLPKAADVKDAGETE